MMVLVYSAHQMMGSHCVIVYVKFLSVGAGTVCGEGGLLLVLGLNLGGVGPVIAHVSEASPCQCGAPATSVTMKTGVPTDLPCARLASSAACQIQLISLQ